MAFSMMGVGATRRGESQVLPTDENTNFNKARLRLQDATKITSMPLAFNTPTVPIFSTPSVMMGNPVRGIVSAVVSLPFFRYPLFGSSGTCWLNQSGVGENQAKTMCSRHAVHGSIKSVYFRKYTHTGHRSHCWPTSERQQFN